jgi:hypothetical protein
VDNRHEKIKNWKKMVSKIEEKFFPVDYQQNLCRQVQNPRKKDIHVHEYTEDFFQLSLIYGINEPECQCVAIYVNGLKYLIEDEMSMHYFHTVDEAYQVSLKVGEKVDRKTKQKLRGRGRRGRGKTHIVRENEKGEESISNQSNI